jgi:hypothetical protein
MKIETAGTTTQISGQGQPKPQTLIRQSQKVLSSNKFPERRNDADSREHSGRNSS